MKKILAFIVLFTGIYLNSNATVITVDINAAGGLQHIQDGINAANNGDTVLVLPGVYFDTINFNGKDIVVASRFLFTQDTVDVSQTVIDGNHINSRLVKFISGETRSARLVGFTITHAYHDQFSYSNLRIGLGIYINNSSPSIENNHILNNEFGMWYLSGGGICIIQSGALIKNNLIQHNGEAFYGAGLYIDSCNNVLIEGNLVDHNSTTSGYGCAKGNGVCIMWSENLVLKNNTISNNYNDQAGSGGGLYTLSSANILIENNRIFSNTATFYGGGICFDKSQGVFTGNLIYINSADIGGGIYFYNSSIPVINSTIVQNVAGNSPDRYGGGIVCENSSPQFYNTILYGDTATAGGHEVAIRDSSSHPSFINCDIQGGKEAFYLADTSCYPGDYTDNIDADPLFSGIGKDPYSLSFESPCVDAGTVDTTGLFLPATDLAGFPRISFGIVDIGAYEYQHCIGFPGMPRNLQAILFPNPATDKVEIIMQNPGKAKVLIYNSSGIQVHSGAFSGC